MEEAEKIVDRIRTSRLVDAETLDKAVNATRTSPQNDGLLRLLVTRGYLTRWQARQLKAGQSKGFFLGDYKLLTPLGAGGTGQVFKAQHSQRNEAVALKILSRRTQISDAVERFRREARAALKLQHPHIVRTFELCHQGPMYFIVMEYVNGKTLKQKVDTEGRLSVEQAARVGHDISSALEHARSLGMVHRDIKPSNIMIDADGTSKLADMGLVKFFGQRTEESAGITRTGFFMGSVDYCAPEQAEDAREADAASDLYSLGCTLYFCLTGGPPFTEGTDVQKIMAHRYEEPIRIDELNPQVPENFANLIHHNLMAKKPNERFPSPEDAAKALRIWLPGGSEDDSFAETLGTLAEMEHGDNHQLPASGLQGTWHREQSEGMRALLQSWLGATTTTSTWLLVALAILIFILGLVCSPLLAALFGTE